MSLMECGTYRGTSEGLTFQFRIVHSEAQSAMVSGDISRDTEFIGSFVCINPQFGEEGRTITGPIRFRGNPELFAGSLYLHSDERGIGSFQLGVDLEGGHQDLFAGRLDWQGSFLRKLVIEIDGIKGAKPPTGYLKDDKLMTVEDAFRRIGFDVKVNVDAFRGGSEENRVRGYTLAEIHAAMMDKRGEVPADRLHTHVFVGSYLAGRGNRGVLGVMYDFEEADINKRPREGIAVFYDHPMLSDPRIPEAKRNREYIFTVVHEIGHALNLLHSFDKARPAALSWMNYPDLYPRGQESEEGYDGSEEFWRRFEESFDAEEIYHLLHASPREIRAGGFPFGVYEEGISIPFGGTASPRRTRLGSNPLRATRNLQMRVAPVKPVYDLGEPVFLSIGVRNAGSDAMYVPDALDPSEGYIRVFIRTPSGRIIRYSPPVRLCKQAQLVYLPPGTEGLDFDGIPLFLSTHGPMFSEPGTYQVFAEMMGVDGNKNALSLPTTIQIRYPERNTEEFAHKLWESPGVLEAMYLRHPLVAREDWKEIGGLIDKAGLEKDNTTASYFRYIEGMGWLTEFATPNIGQKKSNHKKALERFEKVRTAGLPASVADRIRNLAKRKPEFQRAKYVSRGKTIALRSEEQLRVEVPSSGLFGKVGLDERKEGPQNPFERVVPSLRGKKAFADIVSWNIEHLHAESNFKKIPKVAELIRNFRCDFWGLEEVDRVSLDRLKHTINSTGKTHYEYIAVEGAGQQSGAIFRTDTTTVKQLKIPDGFFQERIKTKLANGKTEDRRVFLRDPLLCDVTVRQDGNHVFDFRCAVVHLKSTDNKLKDKGNAMRLAAAKELARWVKAERDLGSERDYLILGDMNAETSTQGLGPFAKKEGLMLLSVGMQDKYGKSQALTRVASQRMLDHIVVTGEAFTSMPKQDKDEQIIIRIDTKISDWTTDYSDHIPVAVRFVIGEDQD